MSMVAGSLEHPASGIVDEPEAMRANEKSLRRGELLEVRAAPVDLGRVIGRNGRTTKALCCVATALSTNGSVRADVVDQERY